jgi:hypothetical protein
LTLHLEVAAWLNRGRLSDWVIAGCTLLGPVLAVQAQKWVEGFREKKARRLTIFRTLMTTRAMVLNPNYVEAETL